MMTGSATDSPTTVAKWPQSPQDRLLERVRDRTDADAWAEFVDVYQPVLSAFARRRGVSAADVPDVVQEVLARLVPGLTRFRFDPSRGQFRSWLWRITSNAASNWRRKRFCRTRAEVAWCQHRPAGTTDPEAADERAHARFPQVFDQILADVRETTTPATWACFEGHVLRGRPAGELATELGVSLNAVYVNTCR